MSASEIFYILGILFPLHDKLWKNYGNKIWKLLNDAYCILVRTTIKRISTYSLGTCVFQNNDYIHVEKKICLYLGVIRKGFGVFVPTWRERSGKANLQGTSLTAKQLRDFPNLQTASIGYRVGLT